LTGYSFNSNNQPLLPNPRLFPRRTEPQRLDFLPGLDSSFLQAVLRHFDYACPWQFSWGLHQFFVSFRFKKLFAPLFGLFWILIVLENF